MHLEKITDRQARDCADSAILETFFGMETMRSIELENLAGTVYPLAIDRLASRERRQTSRAKKLAIDPKQVAKAKAKEMWQKRCDAKHGKRKTNLQFALEVQSHFQSYKTLT